MGSAQRKAEEMATFQQRVQDNLQRQLGAADRAIHHPTMLTFDDIPLPPSYEAEIVELPVEERIDRKAAEERHAKWQIATIIALLTLAVGVAALFFGSVP